LRRCTRVRLSSLRCFFFAMRLRRFLMTEPMLGAYVTIGLRRQPASMNASRR
jgi:hypothetical protein